MTESYYERRISAARGSDSIAADVMRHLHSRQHLGTTIVICEQPTVMLSACRKQWLKLARNVQKQRASTLNADKILKYTHTITRMQHMRFTMKPPLENPEADIYFLHPSQLEQLPPGCMNVYVIPRLNDKQIGQLTSQIAPEALVIDYEHSADWKSFGLKPKSILEHKVTLEWKHMLEFLALYGIQPKELHRTKNSPCHIDAMDEALDELLAIGRGFLQVADSFQHAVEVARPLRTSKDLREQFDVVVLLAHRVQALSPGTFTQRFLETYNEDDTFYLYERVRDYVFGSGESLSSAIMRHRLAGRNHLAEGLLRATFLRAHTQNQMGRSFR